MACGQEMTCHELIEWPTFVEHLTETSSEILKQVEKNNQRSTTRTNKYLLNFLGKFCMTNYHSYYGRYCCPEALNIYESRKRPTTNKRSFKLTWPLVVLIYYLYISLKMLLSVYFQYVYDYHLYRLEYSQIRLNNSMRLSRILIDFNNTDQLSSEDQIKVDKLTTAKRNLLDFGGPFYKSSYFIEIAYQYGVDLSLMTYFIGTIFFNWLHPLDFRFARLILYPKEEQLNYIQLVWKQVNDFDTSSKTFASAYLRAPDVYMNQHVEQTMLDQQDCLKQVKSLALKDQLRPLNWSSGWIEWLSDYYCLFTISCLVWASSIMLITGLTSPLLEEADFKSYTPLDYLMFIENCSVCIYIILATTFYAGIAFLSCIDQQLYIKRLRSSIEERSQQNRAKYHQLIQPLANGKNKQNRLIRNELHLGSMNCNLLYCFMHYKIFVAQFKTHHKTFEIISISSMVSWYILPVMARLHAAYIMPKAKVVQIYISVAMCVVIDCILVPICHLHSCSLDLYKSLSSLLAHSVETQSIEGVIGDSSIKRSLYNKHLIGLLRKELNDPHKFSEQFATIPIGIHITYPSLFRLHFWFGIILLSLISSVTSGRDSLFGGALSDPFGLFERPN